MAKKFIKNFFCGGDILICLSLFSLIMLMTFMKDILLALKNNLKDATKRKSLRFEKAYELCIFLSFKHCEAQGYGDPLYHRLIVLI